MSEWEKGAYRRAAEKQAEARSEFLDDSANPDLQENRMPDNERVYADRPVRESTGDFYQTSSEFNTLNGKRTFDEFQDISLTSARRSQSHYDDLQHRSLKSIDELLGLQAKVNQEFFTGRDKAAIALAEIRARRAANDNMWDYETAYDLGNPTTTGVGDNERAGAIPANRAADVAASGVAAGISESVQTNVTAQVAALVAQTGELIAGVNALSGTISNFLTAQAAANAALIAALTSIASPKGS